MAKAALEAINGFNVYGMQVSKRNTSSTVKKMIAIVYQRVRMRFLVIAILCVYTLLK